MEVCPTILSHLLLLQVHDGLSAIPMRCLLQREKIVDLLDGFLDVLHVQAPGTGGHGRLTQVRGRLVFVAPLLEDGMISIIACASVL